MQLPMVEICYNLCFDSKTGYEKVAYYTWYKEIPSNAEVVYNTEGILKEVLKKELPNDLILCPDSQSY